MTNLVKKTLLLSSFQIVLVLMKRKKHFAKLSL